MPTARTSVSGRWDAAGIINTVAGSDHYRGDGGPAAQAILFLPEDVTTDAQGNLYIADQMNNRIRKVATDGIINNFAGTGRRGAGGDGGPALQGDVLRPSTIGSDPQGNVYFANTAEIWMVDVNGTLHSAAGRGVMAMTVTEDLPHKQGLAGFGD